MARTRVVCCRGVDLSDAPPVFPLLLVAFTFKLCRHTHPTPFCQPLSALVSFALPKMEEKTTETVTPLKAAAHNTHDVEHIHEEPKAGYMQGWALGTLVMAFMSISLVLALDNTILGPASCLKKSALY